MCAMAGTMGPRRNRGERRKTIGSLQRKVSEAFLRRCLRSKAEMEPGWHDQGEAGEVGKACEEVLRLGRPWPA